MAIYFPGKISNQESLFLSWNDPSVNPTEVRGEHILNFNQTAGPPGCRLVQQPSNDTFFFSAHVTQSHFNIADSRSI